MAEILMIGFAVAIVGLCFWQSYLGWRGVGERLGTKQEND